MMRRLLFGLSVLLAGCGSSLDIPSVEESAHQITAARPVLDSLNKEIAQHTRTLPRGHDLITVTRMPAVNRLLGMVAHRSAKDIRIDFLPTHPLWKEERSVLGIGYTNVVNVDSGMLEIDLKEFTFTDVSRNTVTARIEIEGSGTVAASGTYTGISARAAPRVRFYMDETVFFTVAAAGTEHIKLTPVPKTLRLKTNVTVDLAGWSVPYNKEIPLLTSDMIAPVLIPSALESEIAIPLPAARYGGGAVEFVKRTLRLTRSSVTAADNALTYRTDIDFLRSPSDPSPSTK